MKDFINILSKIENLYILKTYSAGEKIIKNATSKKLFINLRKKNKNVKYVINEKKLFEMLQKQTNKNCLIIFMGAGSITKDAYNFMKY
tara:strand:- start:206 stop:469 length:264 start_codon:yes stop_codon:yes gene_type:complete